MLIVSIAQLDFLMTSQYARFREHRKTIKKQVSNRHFFSVRLSKKASAINKQNLWANSFPFQPIWLWSWRNKIYLTELNDTMHFSVKSVLEYNWKHFSNTGIRDSFKRKSNDQILKKDLQKACICFNLNEFQNELSRFFIFEVEK